MLTTNNTHYRFLAGQQESQIEFDEQTLCMFQDTILLGDCEIQKNENNSTRQTTYNLLIQMANRQNSNRANRRNGRGNAWRREFVDYAAEHFSVMWRELGYADNEFQNSTQRNNQHRVGDPP